jgi:hypothetical protein
MKARQVTTVVADDPANRTGKLKAIGGSASDAFNNVLANAALQSLWFKNSDPEERTRQISAVTAALIGIAPKDELESMLAGQLVAANAGAMKCYRRAMIDEQSFEGGKENLNQANKLSRTYVTLLEALNRHRGKGTQQKVTVEHVNVHAGGQALVGAVQAGGGVASDNQRQPHAKALAHAPERPLWGEDQEHEPVPIVGDAERPLPHARRRVSGRTQG